MARREPEPVPGRITITRDTNSLVMPRCPYCGIAKPALVRISTGNNLATTDYSGATKRSWHLFKCTTCGNVVLVGANEAGLITELLPDSESVPEEIPDRPRQYLSQAIESRHAPAGAIMLAASAVDSMLKIRGYEEGSLYSRIDKAAVDHLLTVEMAQWAHEVRLDANDQRHADTTADLPTEADAKRAIDFVMALGEVLFVLPARVARGRKDAEAK